MSYFVSPSTNDINMEKIDVRKTHVTVCDQCCWKPQPCSPGGMFQFLTIKGEEMVRNVADVVCLMHKSNKQYFINCGADVYEISKGEFNRLKDLLVNPANKFDYENDVVKREHFGHLFGSDKPYFKKGGAE